MSSFAPSLSCVLRENRSRGHGGLAALDDHVLRDLGLSRTEIYALPELHADRFKAPCCRLRDAFQIVTGRQPACS